MTQTNMLEQDTAWAGFVRERANENAESPQQPQSLCELFLLQGKCGSEPETVVREKAGGAALPAYRAKGEGQRCCPLCM